MKPNQHRDSESDLDSDNSNGPRNSAFTLVELLVSMAILAVLLLLLSQLLDQVQRSWNYSEGRVSQFREARLAFDLITKNLSQATLNTYWDLEYNRDSNTVDRYVRQSELHFLVIEGGDLGTTKDGKVFGHALFFQAPLGYSNQYRGLSNLLNARGYYLIYGGDERFKPGFVNADPAMRYRLMEYRPPAEENQIYIDGDDDRRAGRKADYKSWYRHELDRFSHPLAENIIAFVVAPRDTIEEVVDSARDTHSRIAPEYVYDSNRHTNAAFVNQLPPLVKVTMVAIDEATAIRIDAQGAGEARDLVGSSLFRRTSEFEDDLKKLSDDLSGKRYNFKVFSTMVAIRSAKWNTYEP